MVAAGQDRDIAEKQPRLFHRQAANPRFRGDRADSGTPTRICGGRPDASSSITSEAQGWNSTTGSSGPPEGGISHPAKLGVARRNHRSSESAAYGGTQEASPNLQIEHIMPQAWSAKLAVAERPRRGRCGPSGSRNPYDWESHSRERAPQPITVECTMGHQAESIRGPQRAVPEQASGERRAAVLGRERNRGPSEMAARPSHQSVAAPRRYRPNLMIRVQVARGG